MYLGQIIAPYSTYGELPTIGELVLATVVDIREDEIYFLLPEYENREELIEAFCDISEVADTEIVNINDYVEVGKTYVAKIINVTRSEVDISLKDVDTYRSFIHEKADISSL